VGPQTQTSVRLFASPGRQPAGTPTCAPPASCCNTRVTSCAAETASAAAGSAELGQQTCLQVQTQACSATGGCLACADRAHAQALLCRSSVPVAGSQTPWGFRFYPSKRSKSSQFVDFPQQNDPLRSDEGQQATRRQQNTQKNADARSSSSRRRGSGPSNTSPETSPAGEDTVPVEQSRGEDGSEGEQQ
jgi:hypothetical protein